MNDELKETMKKNLRAFIETCHDKEICLTESEHDNSIRAWSEKSAYLIVPEQLVPEQFNENCTFICIQIDRNPPQKKGKQNE